jgi:hypothetical protein
MYLPFKTQIVLLFTCMLIAFISCEYQKVAFEKIFIPPVPENLANVNSMYDDYNMAYPGDDLYDNFTLYFSSNRFSRGGTFDIVSYPCWISFNQGSGSMHMGTNDTASRIFFDTHSVNNELGPYFYNDSTLIFSSDVTGTLDFYLYSLNDSSHKSLPLLNSIHNDAYASIHKASNLLYFCSDRLGTFDIFSCENTIETGEGRLQFTPIPVLNSPFNDKCPYVNGNVMVFASDREGGLGGFDLYYSLYDSAQWSAPVNFGPSINSGHDEYRPVFINTDPGLYFNSLLLFSSNRPGGKGGYDLYYVGTPLGR